jgi:hypothetical protein
VDTAVVLLTWLCEKCKRTHTRKLNRDGENYMQIEQHLLENPMHINAKPKVKTPEFTDIIFFGAYDLSCAGKDENALRHTLREPYSK